MRVDFANVLDWFSIKLTGISITLAIITWNQVLGFMSGVALLSTIIYNSVRIYKELKKK